MKIAAVETDLEQLRRLHEQAIEAIECLALDYSGEAKGQLSDLIEMINASGEVAAEPRARMAAAAATALRELRDEDPLQRVQRSASMVIRLRHAIRDAIRASEAAATVASGGVR